MKPQHGGFSGIYRQQMDKEESAMRNFGTCILAFLLFFMAAAAVLEIDRQCRNVTGYGGEITASAEMMAQRAGDFVQKEQE